jgi:prepilin-type N-terminal cleavage/methylation domain-containing protein
MKGFTFIEIILSLMLLSILTAIFGMGLVAAMESYAFSRSNADLAQKGQLAMQRISRELSELVEIRTVHNDPNYIIYGRVQNNVGSPPLKIFMGIYHHEAGDPLYLYSDIGDVSELPIDGDPPQRILLGDVGEFSLAFFSGDGDWVFDENDPLNLDQLSTIRIGLSLNRRDVSDSQQQFSVLVHLRNTGNTGGAHLFE